MHTACLGPARQPIGPERDEFRMNRHRALAYCLSMIFSENRFPLFRIMLQRDLFTRPFRPGLRAA
jgi:hypothetical protein